MSDERFRALIEARVTSPGAVAEAAQTRKPAVSLLGEHGKLMMIAADHPARGALRAGPDPLAMADRAELLNRLCLALSRPGVNGVLGTADILEDLLLLGALDEKVVVGSMNRGGPGRDSVRDGRPVHRIRRAEHQGHWLGRRQDAHPDRSRDPATVVTLEACANAVSLLAGLGLMAMIEPFISHRADGRVHNELTPEAMIRAMTVSAGLGTTSAYTWLKVPVVDGHGARDVGDDTARADSRRRGVCRSGCGVRSMAPGAEVADRQGPGHRPIAVVSAER